MEIALLIKTVIGLVTILAILVFIWVLPEKQKQKEKEKKKEGKKVVVNNAPQQNTDLDSLREVIRSNKSTKKQFKEALDLVIKYHGKIPRKLGTRVNPEFDAYMEILVMICRHPHTDKNIIINFDKELTKLNPEYKNEINESITRGLDSR